MARRSRWVLVLPVLVWLWSPRALAWEVGVAPATRKILPQAPAPSEREIVLHAARGEWEAFQIAIRDAGGAAGVDVHLGDLCAEDGACIPAGQARLYRELFVEVLVPSPAGVSRHERLPGPYPDPLVPLRDPYAATDVALGAPFDLGAGETGVIFADLHVPLDAAAGTYRGSARVEASGGREAEIAVVLNVWDFEIPARKTVATAFGIVEGWIRHYHGGPDGDPAAGYQAIVDRYFDEMHAHRIDPTYLHGPLDFRFDAQGRLEPVDWSAYDDALRPWLDGSRFADGVGVTRFDVHRFKPGRGAGDLTEAQYVQAAAALAEHLDSLGWWDRTYVYAIDEPWLEDPEAAYAAIDRDTDLLFSASELWRGHVLVTGPFEPSIAGKVGIWCPDTIMYADWYFCWDPRPGWDTYTQRLALGEELWFYVCRTDLPPYAAYDIDTAIGYEPRIVKWGAWFERASGFLYWSVNNWVDRDPWHVLGDFANEPDARNGNGFLLYPGDHDGTADGRGSPPGVAVDGPVPSYRLKQIRDGLEDWELFRLACELGAEDFVRQQVRRTYRRFGEFAWFEDCTDPDDPYTYCPENQPWTLDEEVLLDARWQVGQKIQHLMYPDRYPDPEGGSPAGDGEGGCSCGGPPAAVGWLLVLGAALLLAGRLRGSSRPPMPGR
ncbi:MAG: DUF4091 domain-containing protein [Deltaproteobacteria bacterium]|nr:DUF4091 domain-containing protein [Deltaproteobacteria bacterium]